MKHDNIKIVEQTAIYGKIDCIGNMILVEPKIEHNSN